MYASAKALQEPCVRRCSSADAVLKDLALFAEEREEEVETVIARAVKLGIEKIKQELILARYLNEELSREDVVKAVGLELVKLAERQRVALLEDIEWGLHG
jgi:hypothetical protein